jgi:hypothetical protein
LRGALEGTAVICSACNMIQRLVTYGNKPEA